MLTTASLLAEAAVEEGQQVFSVPDWSYDRGGTSLSVSVRIDKSPIQYRSSVSAPDFVMVQDATLLQRPEVTAGLNDKGMFLINTTESALNVKISGQALVGHHTGRAAGRRGTRAARVHLYLDGHGAARCPGRRQPYYQPGGITGSSPPPFPGAFRGTERPAH